MKYRCEASVEIDLIEAFSNLTQTEQIYFIHEFIELLEDRELIEELEKRKYKIEKQKTSN